MNRLLLTALTAMAFAGSGLAYQQATPAMMKAALEPIKTRTLPSGETEITFALPVKATSGKLKGSFDAGRFEALNSFSRSAYTRAEEEETEPYMDFTYAGAPQGYFGLNDMNGEIPVYMMAYFPEEYTHLYNNCRLKTLSFYTSVYGEEGTPDTSKPVNRLMTADLFVAKEQLDVPNNFAYLRKNCRVTAEGAVLQPLDFTEDYIIKEGETFFVGYSVTPLSPDDAFLWFDGQQTNSNNGSLVGIGNSAGNPMTSEDWIGFGREYGNLCIYVTVVGEDLPKDGAQIYTMDVPMQVNVGEEFDARVDVINMNSNPINNIEYRYTLGDGEILTETYELPEPLLYSKVLPITINGLKSEKANLNIPFRFMISKVNGNENYYENASAEMYFKCFDIKNGFEPHVLVESGMATWNGFSPMTMSLTDFVEEEGYSDYYHLATLHFNSDEEEDPMAVPSTDSMVGLFENLPVSYLNRWSNFYPGYYKTVIPEFKEKFGINSSPASVESITAAISADGNTAVTIVDVKFALDMENKDRCRIGLYVTEDNVGRFDQANSFSGLTGDYDGWEKMPNPMRRQVYNNVVRYMAGGQYGLENSLPENIKANVTYTLLEDLDLSKVKGDEFKIIAFVIDNDSEEILNSAVVATSKSADVDDLLIGSVAKVYGIAGAIIIEGEYKTAEIFTIDGGKVASVSSQYSVALPAGIYIAKVDGKTAKVIVK